MIAKLLPILRPRFRWVPAVCVMQPICSTADFAILQAIATQHLASRLRCAFDQCGGAVAVPTLVRGARSGGCSWCCSPPVLCLHRWYVAVSQPTSTCDSG